MDEVHGMPVSMSIAPAATHRPRRTVGTPLHLFPSSYRNIKNRRFFFETVSPILTSMDAATIDLAAGIVAIDTLVRIR